MMRPVPDGFELVGNYRHVGVDEPADVVVLVIALRDVVRQPAREQRAASRGAVAVGVCSFEVRGRTANKSRKYHYFTMPHERDAGLGQRHDVRGVDLCVAQSGVVPACNPNSLCRIPSEQS